VPRPAADDAERLRVLLVTCRPDGGGVSSRGSEKGDEYLNEPDRILTCLDGM
jgi:hypothetical protein